MEEIGGGRKSFRKKGPEKKGSRVSPSAGIFDFRTSVAQVQVTPGFYVPDTLASVVTNALQSPTQLKPQAVTDFVDLRNYYFGLETSAVLTETPTLRVTSANFSGLVPGSAGNTFEEVSRRFWSNLAFKQPYLWMTASTFRSFTMDELCQGIDLRPNLGDSQNQTLGE